MLKIKTQDLYILTQILRAEDYDKEPGAYKERGWHVSLRFSNITFLQRDTFVILVRCTDKNKNVISLTDKGAN